MLLKGVLYNFCFSIFRYYKPVTMKNQSYLVKPEMEKNIDNLERIVSLLGGAYLLYDAFKKRKEVSPKLEQGHI